MGDVLPFMELEGYKRLKEMEDANLRLRKEIDALHQKLDTEIILRQLYEQLSKNRLRKIVELQEHIKDGEKDSSEDQVGGRCQKDKSTQGNSEPNRPE